MDLRTFFLSAIAVIPAYLLGSVPFGFIIVKVVKGIDIRTAGSGNIGATNVARVAGARWGVLVFALDVAKGLIGVTLVPLVSYILAGGSHNVTGVISLLREMFAARGFVDLRLVCGLAVIAGHVWTVFLNFKGGKGVATSLGALLGIIPVATLVTLFVWVVVTRASGYVSLGSIVAAVVLPVTLFVLERDNLASEWRHIALTAAVASIVIISHRGNIRRLMNGTENRFTFGRKPPR